MSPSDQRLPRPLPLDRLFRFGPFEYHLRTMQLCKDGVSLRLQDQPATVLAMLLERAGETVTREELRHRIWPSDTFIAFDAGLNTAVMKVRQVLGDTGAKSLYVETVPRLGYRFIAPIQVVIRHPASPAAPPGPKPTLVPADERALPPAPAAVPGSPPAERRHARRVVAITGLCCVAAAVGFGTGRLSAPVPARQPARLVLPLPPGEDLVAGKGRTLDISRDGGWIAYSRTHGGAVQIAVRAIGEEEAHIVQGTEDGASISFSPDGKRLSFISHGILKTVGIDGSSPRQLATLAAGFDHITTRWENDGAIYFTNAPARPDTALVDSDVWRVADSPAGSPPVEVGPSENRRQSEYPQQLLPNGWLLITCFRDAEHTAIEAQNLKSGARQVVLERAQGVRYLPSGRLVYFYRGNLMAIRFNPDRLKTDNDPVLALEDVSRDGWAGAQAALADNGTLAYVSGPSVATRTFSWIDKDGKESPLGLPPGPYEPLDISPDGKRLLVGKQETFQHNWSLWIVDLGTGRWTRLADGAGVRTGALWSRDGKSVIFASDRFSGDMANLCRMPADGSRPPQQLGSGNPAFGEYPTSLAPDGSIAFSEGTKPVVNSEIRVLPPGATQSVLAVGGQGWKLQPSFSPDGHWLAYRSDVSGIPRIYVRPYPQSGETVAVSPETGVSPIWSPDGHSLFFLSRTGIMKAPLSFSPRLTVGQSTPVAAGPFEEVTMWNRNFLLAPDGRLLVVKNPPAEQRLKQIHVILNWDQELKGMLP